MIGSGASGDPADLATAGSLQQALAPFLWWAGWAEGALLCLGALTAWTLALYVATRGGLRRVSLLTALALALLAVYLMGLVLGSLTLSHPDWSEWLRLTWWGAALVPAVWLLVALALLAEERGPSPRLLLLYRGVGGVLLAVGVLFALVGTFTGLVNDWNASLELPNPLLHEDAVRRHTPRGPLFTAYELYLNGCSAAALLVLLWLWRTSAPGTPLRGRFGWLSLAGLLYLIAGAQLTAASGWFSYSGLPGQVVLAAGIVIMGWNVARYGALLTGQVVSQDFWVFALSMVALVVVYGAALVLLGAGAGGSLAGGLDPAWLRRGIPFLLLVTATHVLADTRSPLLDRLFFGPVAGALRWQLRSLAGRVVRQPDLVTALAEVRDTVDTLLQAVRVPAVHRPERPLPHSAGETAGQPSGGSVRGGDTQPAPQPPASASGPAVAPASAASSTAVASPAEPEASFRLLVESALRHANDLPALSVHALAEHLPPRPPGDLPGPAGTPETALERAGRLRGELEAAIARLAPSGTRPPPGAQAGQSGWLHHLILHEAYVEGRPNKQVMQRYHLSEGTFHRARRRAIDALSLDLHQRWSTMAP